MGRRAAAVVAVLAAALFLYGALPHHGGTPASRSPAGPGSGQFAAGGDLAVFAPAPTSHHHSAAGPAAAGRGYHVSIAAADQAPTAEPVKLDGVTSATAAQPRHVSGRRPAAQAPARQTTEPVKLDGMTSATAAQPRHVSGRPPAAQASARAALQIFRC